MDGGPLSSTYRVAEALPKDVGRGLARLDPKDMAELGVEIGDVIEVTVEADDGRARHAGACGAARQARRSRSTASRERTPAPAWASR